MEFSRYVTGWMAVLFFVFAASYKLIPYKFKKTVKKRVLLNLHCFLGLGASFFALAHGLHSGTGIKFSLGYICLFSMLWMSLSGIVLKYRKLNSRSLRKYLRLSHILSNIILIFTLVLHVMTYYLLSV